VKSKFFIELVHTSRLHELKKELTLATVNVVVLELHALGRILEQTPVKDRLPLVVLSMDRAAVHEVSPYWDAVVNIAKKKPVSRSYLLTAA
jgi:hypothetical protein